MMLVPYSSHESRVPGYLREGDAGIDLSAACNMTLQPFERALIPTGIKLAIPRGYGGFVLPRSGLALKKGLSIVNSPGLIDSNYRGEVQIIAVNLDPNEPIVVTKGDRIAQLVILRTEEVSFKKHDQLDETLRGESGFGSSGV